jgi:hypothetical protein
MSGSLIGYTNDGKVFLTATSKSPNGQPAQVTFLWEPNEALNIADNLKKSVGIVKEKSRIVLGNGMIPQ